MARRSPLPKASAQLTLAMQRTICTQCHTSLHVAHLTSRTIRRLDGVWRLTLPLMRCLNPRCACFRKLCRPEEGRVRVPRDPRLLYHRSSMTSP